MVDAKWCVIATRLYGLLCSSKWELKLYCLQVVEENAEKILEQVPKPLPLLDIMERYPVKYEESMNTVLVQEVMLHPSQI